MLRTTISTAVAVNNTVANNKTTTISFDSRNKLRKVAEGKMESQLPVAPNPHHIRDQGKSKKKMMM